MVLRRWQALDYRVVNPELQPGIKVCMKALKKIWGNNGDFNFRVGLMFGFLILGSGHFNIRVELILGFLMFGLR